MTDGASHYQIVDQCAWLTLARARMQAMVLQQKLFTVHTRYPIVARAWPTGLAASRASKRIYIL